MNHELDKTFTPAEVKLALSQMYPTKAPVINGLPVLFYQRYWDRVGTLVTATYFRCLNDGYSVKVLNFTLIMLIPKVSKPNRVSEFRPISLCNVIYKIISKALCNCFRGVLGSVISENQSAFLLGRMITDNVIIGFKCTQSVHRRIKGKDGLLALKLDKSKAYDRVK
ncbi:hypothetical protein ACOSQ3_024934 [Xanthoceras sorbifolium]